MGKWNLARILVWECILTTAVSLLGGLLLGILFSKASEMLLIHMLGGQITLAFSVDGLAAFRTTVLFLVIFALILLNNLRQIRMSNPIGLLHGTAEGEKPPKGNLLLAILGVVLLAGAYYIAVTIENPVSALMYFFAAVLMVILGTYLIFISGSVVLCRWLKKWKCYYYKPNHFISVSSMLYRMKRNGAGLASICILSTMVLVMISSSGCLYIGKENILRRQYPRDMQLAVWDGEEEHLDLLQKGGFEVEIFGTDAVLVRSVPAMLDGANIADLICEIAEKLLEHKTDIEPEKLDWIFHSTACRAAVKAGDVTSPAEQRLFVEKLLSMPDIRYCPHGRPVMIKVSRYEIERQFGRA